MSFPAFSPRGRSAAAILSLFFAALGARSAPAQTWLAEGPGTFLWSNPNNWTTPPTSSSATQITFNSASEFPFTAQNDLAAPFVLNSLSVGGTGQGRISGNALQFDANGAILPALLQTGPNLFQISAPVILNADATFTAGPAAGPLAFTGVLSGPGALVASGNLAVTYGQYGAPAADAVFAGGATFNGGSLDLFSQTASPAFGSGQITLNNAGLTVHRPDDAAWSIANPLLISGESSIQSERGGEVDLNNHVILAGVLRGKGMMFAAGTQLRIDNSTSALRAIHPTYNNAGLATTISASIVDYNNIVGPNPLHLSSGNTDLHIAGQGNTYAGGTLIEPNAYSSASFVSVASTSSLGVGGVTVQAGARLRLAGTANLAPGKTVNLLKGAFIEFAPTLPLGTPALSMIDPQSEGMLLLTSSPAPGLNLTGHDKLILSTLTTAFISTPYTPAASTYRLVAPAGATLFISANLPAQPVFNGANALVIGQAGFNGNVYLSSPNNFTGGATIASGDVHASAGSLGGGNVTVSGGNLYGGESDILGPSAALDITGGSVFLSMPNHHAGGVNLSAGRLSVDDPRALGSGPLALSGGTLATSIAIPNAVRVEGDLILEGAAGGGGELAGPISLAGSRALNLRNTFALDGNITRDPGDFGTLALNALGTLYVTGPANTYAGGTTLTGPGQVIVDPGSALGGGSVTVTDGELIALGDNAIAGPAARLVVSGGVARLYGDNAFQGGVSVTGGIVEIGADHALGGGDIAISGGILRPVAAARSIPNEIAVAPAGQIDLNGQNLTVGGISGGGAVTNTGPAATLTITHSLRPGDGIGTLTAAAASPGALTIELAPTSTTTIELAGAAPGILHDRLNAGGDIAFDGTLELVRTPGYSPHAGDTFDVITFLSSAGHFERITGIDAGNGLSFAAAYLPDRLRIIAALAGDADLNGAVAFADLATVAQHYGLASQTWNAGDFDGDGIVDFNDLVRIAQNYGQDSPLPARIPGASADFQSDLSAAFAAVPEPGSMTLLIVAGALLITRRGARYLPSVRSRAAAANSSPSSGGSQGLE